MRTAPAIAVLTMVFVAGSMTACSSPPPAENEPGALPIGTATVTINDTDAGTTDAVSCTTAGSVVTITTGDDKSGSISVVSNKDGLTAQSVNLNNLAGFTGSYNAGLGGEATVTMTGRTYNISGKADGFLTADPSFRSAGSFTITAAC